MNKPVVLVVDDTRLNLQALLHILKHDYLLKIAFSGAEALDLVAQEPYPDLILLDVEMPDMNGHEVCRVLQSKSDTSKIPIIFVTGQDSVEEEEFGLSLGAVDYITKPIHPSIVKARVKTHIILKNQYDLLEKIALRDQLTKLYNRHHFADALSAKVSSSIRHSTALSLIVMDIDHFKSINDTYGHGVGDEVLRDVASILLRNARAEDIAARLGGEEFVIVLDNCSLDDAMNKAEFLRQEIEEFYPVGIDVTASLGVIELDKNDTCVQFLEFADQALYRAKKEGRNRVVAYKR